MRQKKRAIWDVFPLMKSCLKVSKLYYNGQISEAEHSLKTAHYWSIRAQFILLISMNRSIEQIRWWTIQQYVVGLILFWCGRIKFNSYITIPITIPWLINQMKRKTIFVKKNSLRNTDAKFWTIRGLFRI